MNHFSMVTSDGLADLYVEASAYEGVHKVAKTLREDIHLVTGQWVNVTSEEGNLSKGIIIIGTYGRSECISRLEEEGKLDCSKIKGKREVYLMQLVENPLPNVEKGLVICGSDKRGTIYGMFRLSETIGVSPWVYWGDVNPKHQDNIILTEEINMVSREPSVRYRGFFINDEWPSFGSWTTEHFGGFTAAMYEKVFQLLLRLKGNYLWPAMWSSSFSLDGPGLLSAELAEIYGVVIGNSHHEPCLRASEEWDKLKGEDTIYGTEWNYYTNKEGLLNFWEGGLKRSGKFESIITIGMRGERDTSMLGENSTLKENIDLLKDIITEQRKLIKKHVDNDLSKVPQLLALYKEVEAYYYGDEETQGLKDWEELQGVTMMLCEDNFGNMRTLPTKECRERDGGYGMYYHFDYHGGPISYEWVNSTPLAKVWEQMTMAYDYGIKEVWIVNVGDLKPQELPLSYFLDLAYDFETYGTNAPNETKSYTRRWVEQQFGAYVSEENLEQITELLEGYTRLNGYRRPEALQANTYHPTYFNEAKRILHKTIELQKVAEQLKEVIPTAMYDAYYGLVYFPCVASTNLIQMQIYSGFSIFYGRQGRVICNHYARLVDECIDRDHELTREYHALAGGKWNGMSSSAHIGFKNWNEEGWTYPSKLTIEPVEKARLLVSYEGADKAFFAGTCRIDNFLIQNVSELEIDIANGGKEAFNYEVLWDCPWLSFSLTTGQVKEQETITMYCNRNLLEQFNIEEEAMVVIKGANSLVTLQVCAQKVDTNSLEPMTFLESNGYIAIEAEHYARNKEVNHTSWQVLKEYGKGISALKMFPTDSSFEPEEEAPTLEYWVFMEREGDYLLELHVAPSNPVTINGEMRYGVTVNDGSLQVINSIPDGFLAGNPWNLPWCQTVLDNQRKSITNIHLREGKNKIEIKGIDPGLVIQRLVIYSESKKQLVTSTYLGPEESFFVIEE